MAFNYSKLNGKIVEIFTTQSNFARAMGVSDRTISLKLNNKRSWRQDEIQRALQLLGLSSRDIQPYFFSL